MTEAQARKILSQILNSAAADEWIEQEDKIEELGYPEIGKIYRDYIYGRIDVHEFYKNCLDHIIIGNSKLGKALK